MYTSSEIRQKFNLQYNNIESGAAPGLNDYELSLYLTQAYKEVVYNAYSGNSKNESIDETERVKTLLRPLIKSITISGANLMSEPSIHSKYISTRVKLPDNLWFLLKSNIKDMGFVANVLPVLQDEVSLLVRNPHKAPSKFRAWRLDETTDDLPNSILVISATIFSAFICTFVEKPTPIILSNLSDILPDLTIESISEETLPSVIASNVWLADLVINRAVELASRDYKENNLNTRMALNARVE